MLNVESRLFGTSFANLKLIHLFSRCLRLPEVYLPELAGQRQGAFQIVAGE